TGAMAASRTHHTATLLPSGQVLVAGGYGVIPLAPVELYDPATERFSTTGRMTQDRNSHTATLLPNGQVLVAGGLGPGGTSVPSTELYDPATGRFSTTGAMTTGRMVHTAALLPNGQVLVAGGWHYYSGVDMLTLASAELYDPTTGRFSATGAMATARQSHTATGLPHARRPGWKVLVAGG